MADYKYLQKIAIVGASGNVGASTLRNLLKINPNIAITIVTREDSAATFPDSSQITLKKGSYDDAAFLQSAFEGNDLAMFSLSFAATGTQPQLIEAAAQAGVKWIIPNEYACNGENEDMIRGVPLFQPKVAARKQIEELARTHKGLKYIAVATNPWTELSILSGMFGIDLANRRIRLFTGSGRFNSSSIEQVGRGIANLVSLPIASPSNPRASLEYYANKYVYISSYSITQKALFDSIKEATGTSDEEWAVESVLNADRISVAKKAFENGEMFPAAADLTYGYYMGEGLGGDYQDLAVKDLEVLGLKEENLDEVVKAALANAS